MTDSGGWDGDSDDDPDRPGEMDLSQFQVQLGLRYGGRGLNIAVDGPNAEILTLYLRDAFCACVQAIENGTTPAEEPGHRYGYDFEKGAVSETNSEPPEIPDDKRRDDD